MMGTISITVGTITVSEDIDDIRLARRLALYAATLTYAEGTEPTTQRQTAKAALTGLVLHLRETARLQRQAEMVAEQRAAVDSELAGI